MSSEIAVVPMLCAMRSLVLCKFILLILVYLADLCLHLACLPVAVCVANVGLSAAHVALVAQLVTEAVGAPPQLQNITGFISKHEPRFCASSTHKTLRLAKCVLPRRTLRILEDLLSLSRE